MSAGLDSNQLRALVASDRRVHPSFLGVFAADQLPVRIVRRPSALIVNTDLAHQPGSHWVAMLFGPEEDEFFDSYGKKTYHKKWETLLRPGYRYNTHVLQGNTTTVCGHYCYYYLAQRFRARSMEDIVRAFPGPTSLNDRLVCHWVGRTPPAAQDPTYCQTSVCRRRQGRRVCD